MPQVASITDLGNQVKVLYDDGTVQIAYPTVLDGNWIVGPVKTVPPPDPPDPANPLIDTILPGHRFAEGTLAADWQWHLDNANNRGGSDLNFIFEDVRAPGAGTITAFEVGGVGLVIKLVLDTPAVRTKPAFAYDQHGPMVAIWFQHMSSNMPNGHVNQGDIIGRTGDGWGEYPAHLHIHGLTDTGNVAGNWNRTCFWHFL